MNKAELHQPPENVTEYVEVSTDTFDDQSIVHVLAGKLREGVPLIRTGPIAHADARKAVEEVPERSYAVSFQRHEEESPLTGKMKKMDAFGIYYFALQQPN